jgi:YD repeat-containing protein
VIFPFFQNKIRATNVKSSRLALLVLMCLSIFGTQNISAETTRKYIPGHSSQYRVPNALISCLEAYQGITGQCGVAYTMNSYGREIIGFYYYIRYVFSNGTKGHSRSSTCNLARSTFSQPPWTISSCNEFRFYPAITEANNGSSDNNTCNPINIATGNKFFEVNDFVANEIHPLNLIRYYNSDTDGDTWTFAYGQMLQVSQSEIQAHRSDGQVIIFPIDDDILSFLPGQRARLIRQGDQFELTLSNNVVETYNATGQLLSIEYPSGITHNFSYSSDNHTITVTRLNQSLVLHLVDGNVVRALLPDSSVINYVWDMSSTIDRLITVIYADNTTRTYLYENTAFPSYITGILNENGNRISSVQYDTQGRAISSEVGELNSGIERSQIEYHDDGRRTVTNALGKQNIYHFTDFNGEYKMTQVEGQASANCASANQAYTYDTNGFMASKTDWKGNVTSYIHNDRGLETARTEADGTSEARTILTEWHATLNLRTKVTEPERETVFAYDADGRLTSTEVSPR